MGGAGVVSGMGRVGEVHHGGAPFSLGQQRPQRVGEEGRLGRCVGLARHGRGRLYEYPSRCSRSVRPGTE